MSGILDGLWGRGGGSRGPAEPMLEVLLMAGLAEGEPTPALFDRIARAVRDQPRLQSADWDWIVHRAGELAAEAPLFFDARSGVIEALGDAEDQRLALALAARIVGGGHALSDETRAVLGALGRGFGIAEPELDALLAPAITDSSDLGFVRCAFNDPRADASVTLLESLRSAADDAQRRLLLFKLAAARRLAWTWGADGSVRVLKLGEPLRFDALHLRVDVVVERDGRRGLTRCVAPGEALHREEYALIKTLTDRLPETAQVVIVHEGPLSPEDDSFVRGVDPSRLATVELVPREEPSLGPFG